MAVTRKKYVGVPDMRYFDTIEEARAYAVRSGSGRRTANGDTEVEIYRQSESRRTSYTPHGIVTKQFIGYDYKTYYTDYDTHRTYNVDRNGKITPMNW